MKKLFAAWHYFLYLIKSTNAHGVHSPFVFGLLNHVIYNKKPHPVFADIEALRSQLLCNNNEIVCEELGAGSHKKTNSTRTIKHLARYSAKSKKYGQLLFRFVNHFQPSTILELGTSLGISTAYIALAYKDAKVMTIEGCEEIAACANQNFKTLNIKNVEQVTGNFDTALPLVLQKKEKVDLVFFDGNHRKQATIDYFYRCLEKAHEGSIFVFDDIYWSKEMMEAWEEIKTNKHVTVSVDLFFIGIVFFRTEQVKQNFVIRF